MCRIRPRDNGCHDGRPRSTGQSPRQFGRVVNCLQTICSASGGTASEQRQTAIARPLTAREVIYFRSGAAVDYYVRRAPGGIV